MISILCYNCFDLSKHEGHNFQKISNPGEGICDCGNADFLDPAGFCSKHVGLNKKALALPAKITQFFEKNYSSKLQALLVNHLSKYLLLFYRPLLILVSSLSSSEFLLEKAMAHFQEIKIDFPDLTQLEKIGKTEKSELKKVLLQEIGRQIGFIKSAFPFRDLIFSSANTQNLKGLFDRINQNKIRQMQIKREGDIKKQRRKIYFDANLVEYRMRLQNNSIQETLDYIQVRKDEIFGKKHYENDEVDSKRNLKIRNFSNFIKSEIFKNLCEKNEETLLLNSREMFKILNQKLNDTSQLIFLMSEVFFASIEKNKLISSNLKQICQMFFQIQYLGAPLHGPDFTLKAKEILSKKASILDLIPYLDTFTNNIYHLGELNQILIDFSSDEDFAIHFTKACFRQRFILNHFTKINKFERNSMPLNFQRENKFVCIMRLSTTNICDKTKFTTSMLRDVFWNSMSMNKIYSETLSMLNIGTTNLEDSTVQSKGIFLIGIF